MKIFSEEFRSACQQTGQALNEECLPRAPRTKKVIKRFARKGDKHIAKIKRKVRAFRKAR